MTFTCRSCGVNNLELILSLGDMPLANGLLTEEQLGEPEATFPLDVAFCPDCTLLQVTETVPPEAIFCDYPYLSSFSDTNVACARENAEAVMNALNLGATSLVMEIGSNDGYLLQFYAHAGIPVLGIDPAANIVAVAEGRGVPTLCAFFGRDVADGLREEGKVADVIHLNNTFAHIADLNGLVAGLGTVLKDDGIIVIQVPYAREMIEHVEFDTIYHEHLCYFSVTALDNLFHRHGLEVVHVDRLPIHGGSLRVFVGKEGQRGRSEDVFWLLREEEAAGMNDATFYRAFGQRVRALRHDLSALLRDIKNDGKRIVGYAASAKGSTLLNYCGIGGETLDYVVDRSTVKQGRYTPGTHLLIEPPERLLETMPDYALLLAWNYVDEILAREVAYRQGGGCFIVPIPEPRILAGLA